MPVINIKNESEDKIVFNKVYDSVKEFSVIKTDNNLSSKKYELKGASVGNYALFAGGTDGSYAYSAVDAYNSSLTRSSAYDLSYTRVYHSGCETNNYAIFAGGTTSATGNSSTTTNAVNAYNSSLTRSNPTSLIYARYMLTSARSGVYALFAGGIYSNNDSAYVEAYNDSLTRISLTDLYQTKRWISGATVGDYALFAGGGNNGLVNTVSIYYYGTRQKNTLGLSVAKYSVMGASVGNYALFAGGITSNTSSLQVDAFDTSLTSSTITALSGYKTNGIGIGLNNKEYAFFVGDSGVVDVYDSSLTRSIDIPNTSYSKGKGAAATVGDYALFAGGVISQNNYSDSVDACCHTPYYTLSMTIPPFSKYKFTENSEQSTLKVSENKTYKLSSTTGGISGYIKPNANNYFTGQIS